MQVITPIIVCLLCCLILFPAGTLCATADKGPQHVHKHDGQATSQVHNALVPRTWSQIAAETGTDKYQHHLYQHVYEDLLEPIRHTPLKFMEIGLGMLGQFGHTMHILHPPPTTDCIQVVT